MKRPLLSVPGGRSSRGHCSRPPIKRVRFATTSHSLARHTIAKMYKLLVLVGFVACAVAAPAPEEAAPVRQARGDGYMDCVTDCGIKMGAPWNPGAAACFAMCAFKRRNLASEQAVDFTRLKISSAVAMDVESCFERCGAAYSFSMLEFRTCIYRCSHGEPGLQVSTISEVKPQSIVMSKRACTLACSMVAGDFYSICVIATCSGLRRSLEDNKDEMIDGDFKKVPVGVSARPSFDMTACLAQCSREKFSQSYQYQICVRDRCHVQFRSLNDVSFAGVSLLPVDSDSPLMQITGILSQVIKKQQELEQMIQSCKCAKPLTPFSLDNVGLGPYY